jgi:sec-independent protein translocase protein TatA
MFGLGPTEWICIFLVILLIFGGRKLPEVARGLGKALREFRKARDELHEVVNRQIEDDESDGSTTATPGDGQAKDRAGTPEDQAKS